MNPRNRVHFFYKFLIRIGFNGGAYAQSFNCKKLLFNNLNIALNYLSFQ